MLCVSNAPSRTKNEYRLVLGGRNSGFRIHLDPMIAHFRCYLLAVQLQKDKVRFLVGHMAVITVASDGMAKLGINSAIVDLVAAQTAL